MARLAELQHASAGDWANAALTVATIVIPIASLAIGVLLLLPATSDYFAAMRRSGQY
jgi:hypothetical protein